MTANSHPKRKQVLIVCIAVAIILGTAGVVFRKSAESVAKEVTKKIQTVPGSGKPIIVQQFTGNNAVHFPEFPVTIFMRGKPEPVPVTDSFFSVRVKLQCDAICGYRSYERGTLTSIIGLWLTPVGLARIGDQAGLESMAREIAGDSAPGGTPFAVASKYPATGILSHIKDGTGARASLGMSFVKFDKGLLVMSFAAADDKSATWMAATMAESASFEKLPADWQSRRPKGLRP